MRTHFFIFSLLLLLLTCPAQAATLSASVDRSSVNTGETVTLTLQYDESGADDPDTSTLEQQFNIVNRSKSSRVSIINGDATSTTLWYFELEPKTSGKLLIPSFNIDGNFSNAITLDVGESAKNRTQAQSQQNVVYTETELDHAQVHVQQQAIITWRLVSQRDIDDPQLQPPQIDGVLTQDLGSRQYQRAGANGAIERVIEQRFALFPQHSGTVTIPEQIFQVAVVSMRRSTMGIMHPGYSKVRLKTEAQTLQVLPADTTQQQNWLPAISLSISEQLPNRGQAVTVGTAFTRTIHLRAEGLSAEQLPVPDMEAPGIKVYAEAPVLNNETEESGVVGTRADSAAIVATQPGTLVLPAIRIPWYDTRAAVWKEAVLPETRMEVLPAPGSAATPATPQPTVAAPSPATQTKADDNTTTTNNETTVPDNTQRRWQWGVAALSALLVLAGAYIWQLRQRLQASPAVSPMPTMQNSASANTAAFAAMQKSVAEANWPLLHRQLMMWQQAQPENRQQLGSVDTQGAMQSLEKHLFGQHAAPDTNALQALLTALQSTPTNHKESLQQTQLAPLYRS